MGFAACLPLLPHVKRPSSPAPFHISCGRSDFLYVQPQVFIWVYLKTAFETLHLQAMPTLSILDGQGDFRMSEISL